MPMPGDHIAADAEGDGCPGAWHADCEQVIEVLKAAFVQGRLTKDEFGTRLGQAFASQTYAELAEVTADLPAGPAGTRPPRQLARTRPRLSMNAALTAGAFAMIAALMGLMAAVVSRSAIGVISAAVGIAIIGTLAFGALMVASWQDRAPRTRRLEVAGRRRLGGGLRGGFEVVDAGRVRRED
jgi:hypothetical protein